MTDHLNTVRDIAQYNSQTDTTTVLNHLVYDTFGKVTSESNPAVDSLFLFTARPFDTDSQLQNNLNRWHDARVDRWLSEDPPSLTATPEKSTLHVFEDGILEARENKLFLIARRMLARLSANTLALAR